MVRKKTDAEFRKEVYDLVGNEYTFLDDYQGAHTKIKARHNKCGNAYSIDPANFLRGSRCPYCYGNNKKTDAQFKQEILGLVGGEYTFLDSYINDNSKLRVKHNKCGNIYEVRPSNFIQGNRCPYCSDAFHPKKTDAQFKKEVYDLVDDEYTFLEHYQGSQTKIRVKHNKCGHVYKVIPNAFIKGNRCPYCAKINRGAKLTKSNIQFKQEVKNLVGNEYTFLDSYVNNYTKIKVKHNKCGHVYKVNPSNFLNGKRCPYCNGGIKKTNIQFKRDVKNLVGNEYIFLDDYITNKTKLRVVHNKCNNIYEVTPSDFLTGYRCPYCNSPKGEVTINKILKSLGIKYEYQKTFDDLSDKTNLSYDFFVPDQNILIEYQGLQHYQPVDHFGGKPKFKVQQEHDKMKSDYAKTHNYKLIAVPYTEDTFSKIKKYLLQHGLKVSA